MKDILFLAAACVILFTSCSRYSQCTDPYIGLRWQVDSTGSFVYEFDTYEKGTLFTKLISSERDSAYLDTMHRVHARHIVINASYDYMIRIPETGKTYLITDIGYSGDTKVKAAGLVSENKTKCTRTVSYTINGQISTVEGTTYTHGHGRPNEAVITITK